MAGEEFQGPRTRRAGPADATAIAALFLASRQAAMPWLPVLHGVKATIAFFRDQVPRRAEVWLELASDRELSGFIAFGGGEVEHLYVAPSRRGQGIGGRLLALAQARRQPLELWVFQRNQPALRFYQRQGFRPIGESNGDGNEEREPAIRLHWAPVDGA